MPSVWFKVPSAMLLSWFAVLVVPSAMLLTPFVRLRSPSAMLLSAMALFW